MEEVIEIMREASEERPTATAGGPGRAALQQPARLVFRDVLLGIILPDPLP